MRREITDISTLLGILAALALVAYAIYIGSSSGQGSIEGFIDIKAIFIVFGGTLFLTIGCFSFRDVFRAIGSSIHTIFYYSEHQNEAALNMIEIAEIANKKGLLELQKHDDMLKRNPFLRKGLLLLVDGININDAERIMRKEISAILQRHHTSTEVIHKASDIAPAMGLIGTLIGLVLMLGNLSDPSTIGPSMAIALLTTLYGAMLAYMVLIPLATKLDRNTKEEAKIMYIYLTGIISVGKKETPRRLEMLINASLPPSQRITYFK